MHTPASPMSFARSIRTPLRDVRPTIVRQPLGVLLLCVAIAACGGGTTNGDVGTPDGSTQGDGSQGIDATSGDSAASDVPRTDTTLPDVVAPDTARTDTVAQDTPTRDAPATDASTTDVVSSDVVSTDVVSRDAPAADAGGICVAQDARGEGACALFLGYFWNGSACAGQSGCRCTGVDCMRGFSSMAACQAAYAGCSSVPSDCRTTGCPPGNTCMPCRGVGGLVYACLRDGTAC